MLEVNIAISVFSYLNTHYWWKEENSARVTLCTHVITLHDHESHDMNNNYIWQSRCRNAMVNTVNHGYSNADLSQNPL